ncbi:peptide-methionine (S)-S-oxide reductase MsrA [Candidatus Berkelbacteria bacterium]|nr:peptide-methionine (S)-S-oxide reductase MsrA [Candidatus Berkelbacteria bacterium]
MELKEAAFAAGCFWGVEDSFRQLAGVEKTEVGYMGGNTDKPSYEQVCSGKTGHAETLHLKFDPEVISYQELLKNFWEIHDPTTMNKQGPDIGSQYRSVIFYYDENQKNAAEQSKQELDQSGKYSNPIVTEVTPATAFNRAEEYHQQYYEKNPHKPKVC